MELLSVELLTHANDLFHSCPLSGGGGGVWHRVRVTDRVRVVDGLARGVAPAFGAGLFLGLAPASALAGWWLVAGMVLAAGGAVLFALSTSDEMPGPAVLSLGILGRIAAAVPVGGYLVYTCQPWHPQLELIARALRAGHSLAAGFNLCAHEMTAPISKEFSRVFEEQNLGIPLEEALDNMTDRIPNLDLRFFATAVVLQRQTGGDLAEILDKIGYIVRERFKIWGQVQALTGEGRLSGIVLLALPPALFLAVYRLNPDYVMPLFTDPMGRQMLAAGVIMQLLGAVVIRKIINIKV